MSARTSVTAGLTVGVIRTEGWVLEVKSLTAKGRSTQAHWHGGRREEEAAARSVCQSGHLPGCQAGWQAQRLPASQLQPGQPARLAPSMQNSSLLHKTEYLNSPAVIPPTISLWQTHVFYRR
jgi:hypothetical protein